MRIPTVMRFTPHRRAPHLGCPPSQWACSSSSRSRCPPPPLAAQYLGDLQVDYVVFKNDEKTVDEIRAMNPRGILVSPGPGGPGHGGRQRSGLGTGCVAVVRLGGHVGLKKARQHLDPPLPVGERPCERAV